MKSLAIIGVGNVGSRVARKAQALGMRTYLCDPPLREATGDTRYRALDDVLEADILTFHVPLSSGGAYPTWHMLDKQVLGRLSPEQFLVNSSRGPVFDDTALKNALGEKRISGAVLDVWEGEPVIDYSLLELVDIGTPHIAGVAMDAKVRATEMVRKKLSRYFRIQSSGLCDSVYTEPRILSPEPGTHGQEAVTSVLMMASGIREKDAGLRSLASLPEGQAAAGFDRLRNEIPLRLEFRHFIVDLCHSHRDLAGAFQALGFKIRI